VNGVVLKDRYCFLYEGQYFELDDFLPMKRNICMLEVELSDEAAEVRLPPWINVIKEVTDDPAYSNREIALGGDDS
jgi:CYTH domain-containing protein